MASTPKVYTPEFKLRAVTMITEQKLSVFAGTRAWGTWPRRITSGLTS